MKTVGIIGSCISRDVFNSKHVNNWKEFFDVTAYQSQITIPSLISKPVKYDENNAEYNNMDDFSINQINTELNKTVLEKLSDNPPDYLIVDFYGDLFFGVVKAKNGGYITNKKWMFSRTNIFNENIEEGQTLNFLNNFNAYFELWCESIRLFFVFLKEKLPNTKVIIHHSKFVGIYEENNIVKSVGKAIGVHKDTHYLNRIWEEMTNHLNNNYDIRIINQTEKNYKINHNHIWGVHYVHFENEYYTDFKNKLIDIIIGDDITLYNKKNDLTTDAEIVDFKWNSTNKNVIINDDKYIQIWHENSNKNLYSQCYSNEILFNYKSPINIQFQIYIDSKIKLDDNRIFTIRTFNEIGKYTQSEANQYYYYSIENYNLNQWNDIKIELNLLDGKYFRIIPILFKNGDVKFRDIVVKHTKNKE